uniref:Putative phd finger found in protein n=1 Tax=Lutzomyia longipalpis TaxID=7200 RepID=A0A1B0CW91_LUTLO
MSHCKDCKGVIARNDVHKVQCAGCSSLFHGTCVRITASALQSLKQRNVDWKCSACKPRRDSIGGESALTALIGDLRKELSNRADEMQDTASKLKKIANTLESLARDSAESKRRITVLEEKAGNTEQLLRDNEDSKRKIALLERKVLESERMACLSSIELHGIPQNITDEKVAIDILRNALAMDLDECTIVRKKAAKNAQKSSGTASNTTGGATFVDKKTRKATNEGTPFEAPNGGSLRETPGKSSSARSNGNVWIVQVTNNATRRQILRAAKIQRQAKQKGWLQCKLATYAETFDLTLAEKRNIEQQGKSCNKKIPQSGG